MGSRKRAPSPLLAAASSLIGEASSRLVTPASRFRHSFEVPVARIAADPEQPRKHFDAAEIAALAATMAEHGQLQPVLLRRDPGRMGDGARPAGGERWILVAGERRWRAARLNGWTSLLAIEVEDAAAEVMTILENLQRVDLSPVEEARGLQRLIARRHWSQDRAAEALGRSKAEISASLRILTLPAELLDRVLTSELKLSRNALVELSRAGEPTRRALLARAREEGLTVRDIRAARPRSGAGRPAPAGSDVRTADPAGRSAHPGSDVRTGRRGSAGSPLPAPLDTGVLDAAAEAIEAAIRDAVAVDGAAWRSLDRLRQAADSLLRASTRPPGIPAGRR